MINIGILDFLMSTAHHIFSINCSSSFEYVDNLFEKILTARYCTADINLGVFYIKKNSDNNYLLIDGKRRLLSLMLLTNSSPLLPSSSLTIATGRLSIFPFP